MIEIKTYIKHYENLSLNDIEGEIWKEIEGYEGIYLISNKGRIKSLGRYYYSGAGNKLKRYAPDKIRIQSIVNGYPSITLNKGGKMFFNSTHRLLAIYFLSNPNNLPCINHKNGNRGDLDLDNLEWCTYSYNAEHGFRSNGRTQKSGKEDELSKPFIAIDVKTGEEQIYYSQREAAKKLNSYQTNIWKALNKGNKHKGYKFQYLN